MHKQAEKVHHMHPFMPKQGTVWHLSTMEDARIAAHKAEFKKLQDAQKAKLKRKI